MTQLAEEPNVHLSNFTRLEERAALGNGNGTRPAWLDGMRRGAIARFQQAGFPSGRDEHWRHTNFAPIVRTPFQLADGDSGAVQAEEVASRAGFGDEAAAELVFVNGVFAPNLSNLGGLPRGVQVTSLAAALQSNPGQLERHLGRHADVAESPFVALNTGFIADGAFVHVPRGVEIEGPIHLLFASSSGGGQPTVSHPRVLVVAEDNTRVSVVESYVG